MKAIICKDCLHINEITFESFETFCSKCSHELDKKELKEVWRRGDELKQGLLVTNEKIVVRVGNFKIRKIEDYRPLTKQELKYYDEEAPDIVIL